MGKLITLSDAAKKLGVERQNLEHWAKRGVIKIKKMANKGSGYWVDEATIDSLLDCAMDAVLARKFVEVQKEQLINMSEMLDKKIISIKREIGKIDRYGRFFVSAEFYESLPEMFCSLGLIKEREAKVMRDIIKGNTLEEVSEDFMISRERIYQIFRKAIRKSKDLSSLKEKMDELENTKFALKEAQKTIEALTRQLKSYMDKEERKLDEQKLTESVNRNKELVKLLNKDLKEFDLTVRTLNCLRSADIWTVSDLVQHAKTDLLKFRNFGKKSIIEINDFLEENNLTFSMDVEQLYNDNVKLLISKMQC